MKILMVCLGNICRSPVAEGILRTKSQNKKLAVEVDSAGTSGWHDGEKPDPRSISNAQSHGVNISNQKSRKVRTEDFQYFDKIYVMDQNNYQHLMELAPAEYKYKIDLILNEVYPAQNKSVPDPYYTSDGFEEVFELLDAACEKIVKKIEASYDRN